ncbi:methionyl-tRNA formyltransferase [Bacteroidota bacterium]
MNMKDLRIVFMGTPDFATESLKTIYEKGLNIAGVITAPDKPSGRGLKLIPSSVKKYCIEKNIKLLQPEKLKDQNFINELKAFNGNLFVVVAFRMLPEVVWELPEFGTINLHASLLPDYRGAAPINWAIIHGEKESGLTTFFIDKEIDTGKIILQKKLNIGVNETAGDLHDKLKTAGADLLIKTIALIADGNVSTISQSDHEKNNRRLKPAPKISKEDCQINWNQPNINVHNFIRGLSPYPGAWTRLLSSDNQTILMKIYKSEIGEKKISGEAGVMETDGKTYLEICCSTDSVNILEIQTAGKKRMEIQEFLRGFQNLSSYTLG